MIAMYESLIIIPFIHMSLSFFRLIFVSFIMKTAVRSKVLDNLVRRCIIRIFFLSYLCLNKKVEEIECRQAYWPVPQPFAVLSLHLSDFDFRPVSLNNFSQLSMLCYEFQIYRTHTFENVMC
jgi:hypothetical protein